MSFIYETFVYDIEYVEDEETEEVTPVERYAVRITGYKGSENNIIIPEEIDGLPVIEIADRAFYRKTLTSAVFPDAIESIGNESFSHTFIEYIVVYGYDTNAMHDSFDEEDLYVIYGYSGSNIESYAESKKFEFREIGTYDTTANILSVEELPEQEVMFGEDPYAPDKVSVTLDNNDVISLNVYWDSISLAKQSTIDLLMTATIILPKNITNTNNIRAKMIVKVIRLNVIAVEEIPHIELEFGEDIIQRLERIPTVKVTLDDVDGTEINVPVTWHLGDFDSNTPGDYTIKGELHLSSYYDNTNNLQPSINVTVDKRFILDVDLTNKIEVAYGTERDLLPIPSVVNVDLSDGTGQVFDVIWRDNNYNGNEPNQYEFIGDIVTDEVTDNRLNKLAMIMVVVQSDVVDGDFIDYSHNIIEDLEGNQYVLDAVTETTHTLNGSVGLNSTIHSNEANDLFIDEIDKLWKVIDHRNVKHNIVYIERKGLGYTEEVPIYENEIPTNYLTHDYQKWEKGWIRPDGTDGPSRVSIRTKVYTELMNAKYIISNQSKITRNPNSNLINNWDFSNGKKHWSHSDTLNVRVQDVPTQYRDIKTKNGKELRVEKGNISDIGFVWQDFDIPSDAGEVLVTFYVYLSNNSTGNIRTYLRINGDQYVGAGTQTADVRGKLVKFEQRYDLSSFDEINEVRLQNNLSDFEGTVWFQGVVVQTTKPRLRVRLYDKKGSYVDNGGISVINVGDAYAIDNLDGRYKFLRAYFSLDETIDISFLGNDLKAKLEIN